MLINLSDVLSESHQPIVQETVLEMDAVKLEAGTYAISSREPVQIEVTHIKGKELLIKGRTCLRVSIPCDRCLKEVLQELRLDFAKTVDLSRSEADEGTEFEETNYIDGYYLDVDQLLYNEILIGWPMKVLCCEDCKGICSVCGQNLNEGNCNCEDTSLDPRMSAIRDVFKNFKEV